MMPARAPAYDSVRQLILDRSDARGKSLKELSLKLGRNDTYLQQFVTKGSPRKLDEEARAILSDELGIHPDLLRATTTGKDVAKPAKSTSIVEVEGEEFARVPLFAQRASAGHGALAEDAEPKGWRLFDLAWIRTMSRSRLDMLKVIEVAGDSMEATLHNGDHVLIDLGRRSLAQPGIFVLRLDDELVVKRIQKKFRSGAVTLISDNPKYQAEEIKDPADLDVVGRVVWLGRNVG